MLTKERQKILEEDPEYQDLAKVYLKTWSAYHEAERAIIVAREALRKRQIELVGDDGEYG